MTRDGLVSAMVIDREGRVVAALDGVAEDVRGEGRAAPSGHPAERVPLPGGGFLVGQRGAGSEGWRHFARAFVHEARSPLNALAIYLELLQARVGADAATAVKPELAADRLLERANEQVRRVEVLLRAFGELWAPDEEAPADLAVIGRAACRLAEHHALRRGVSFRAEFPDAAPVAGSGARVADVWVSLLDGLLKSPPPCAVSVCVQSHADGPVLQAALEAGAADIRALVEPALGPLRRAGARVIAGQAGLQAWFPPPGQTDGGTGRRDDEVPLTSNGGAARRRPGG